MAREVHVTVALFCRVPSGKKMKSSHCLLDCTNMTNAGKISKDQSLDYLHLGAFILLTRTLVTYGYRFFIRKKNAKSSSDETL